VAMAASSVPLQDESPHRFLPCVSPQMQALTATMARVAAANVPVLICGETGSGKSALAQQLDEDRPQRSAPMLVLHSASATADAVDELSQMSERTILFEEVGELAPSVQDSLIRLLADASRRALRFICTSSVDLAALTERHGMRADLRFRLDVVRLAIPPLRQRPQDIIFLAEHFLTIAARHLRRDVRGLGADARDRLLEHRWPGNVRELYNCIVESVLQCAYVELRAEDVRLRAVASVVDAEAELGAALTQLYAARAAEFYTHTQRLLLQWALNACGGNRVRAAALLGLGRGSLRAKLRRHGLDRSAEEP